MARHKLTVRGSGYGGGAAGVSGETYDCGDTATDVLNTRIWYRKSTGAGLFSQVFGAKAFTVHSGFINKSVHDSLKDIMVIMQPQNSVKTRAHAAYFLYWKKAG